MGFLIQKEEGHLASCSPVMATISSSSHRRTGQGQQIAYSMFFLETLLPVLQELVLHNLTSKPKY
jgi:hypothetical protein